jgi:hypothetical protein
VYQQKNYDINYEVDYQGVMHLFATYNIYKNVGVQLNIEANPFARFNKKNKKYLRSFGVGLKINSTPVEEEIQNLYQTDFEDTYEEYEYDKIMKETIK